MYRKFRKWCCKKFGWHKEGCFTYFDNFKSESVCKYCDKRIVMKYYSHKWEREDAKTTKDEI